MTDHRCKKCGKKLMTDEIALHRKLFSRAAREFMCLACQAAYLRIDQEYLENLIARYHKEGTCMLFAKLE